MERRHFLKLAAGLAVGTAAIATGSKAAPLAPISAKPGFAPAPREAAEPAVVTQGQADHLKPEEVRWHHHWHHRWHRRWHRWHHWHRHHWHRRWHRRHW